MLGSPEVTILGDVRLVLPILLFQYYYYLMMLGELVESFYVLLPVGQESAETVAQDMSLWDSFPLGCHYPQHGGLAICIQWLPQWIVIVDHWVPWLGYCSPDSVESFPFPLLNHLGWWWLHLHLAWPLLALLEPQRCSSWCSYAL